MAFQSHTVHPSHLPKNTQPLERVPLLDIGRENAMLEQEILAAVTRVSRSGRFVLGPECERLEQRIASLCQVPHAVGCASGSEALLLALMAIDLQPGDEVIVPSFTFFSTASAVWRLGGLPVFVDIDPRTYNIDPDKVEAAVTSKTRAIIPVHLFGQSANMQAINEIAARHHLMVIEDAAQAIGAEFQGQPVGSIGDIGCLSFYPTKNLGGFGDGGMLTVRSPELADKLEKLRGHGMRPRYYHEIVGINSRLDTLQAAVLNVKLPNLQTWTAARRENARQYSELLQDQQDWIVLPEEISGTRHVWNQYTIRVKHGLRDPLRDFLRDHGVGSEIYYPVPLHQQECFQALPAPRSELGETERAALEVLSLPIFPTMTRDEQETVAFRVAQFFATHRSARPAIAATTVPAIAPITTTLPTAQPSSQSF